MEVGEKEHLASAQPHALAEDRQQLLDAFQRCLVRSCPPIYIYIYIYIYIFLLMYVFKDAGAGHGVSRR